MKGTTLTGLIKAYTDQGFAEAIGVIEIVKLTLIGEQES